LIVSDVGTDDTVSFSWGSIENWLELKIEPSLANLAKSVKHTVVYPKFGNDINRWSRKHTAKHTFVVASEKENESLYEMLSCDSSFPIRYWQKIIIKHLHQNFFWLLYFLSQQ
jgi:hypothetical protein